MNRLEVFSPVHSSMRKLVIMFLKYSVFILIVLVDSYPLFDVMVPYAVSEVWEILEFSFPRLRELGVFSYN